MLTKQYGKKLEIKLVKLLKELNLCTTKVLSVNTIMPVKISGTLLAKYLTARK